MLNTLYKAIVSKHKLFRYFYKRQENLERNKPDYWIADPSFLRALGSSTVCDLDPAQE